MWSLMRARYLHVRTGCPCHAGCGHRVVHAGQRHTDPTSPRALQARAIRTDACVLEVVRVAEERLGMPRRAQAL